jgi:hypothetical protein
MSEDYIPFKDNTFQASWHLAGQIIDALGSYLRRGGEFFLEGKLDKYFWTLVLVKRRIFAFLDETEQKEINGLEKEIKLILPIVTLKGFYTKPEFVDMLEGYDAKLMFFLRKYGMLVPPKKDKTVMIA